MKWFEFYLVNCGKTHNYHNIFCLDHCIIPPLISISMIKMRYVYTYLSVDFIKELHVSISWVGILYLALKMIIVVDIITYLSQERLHHNHPFSVTGQ